MTKYQIHVVLYKVETDNNGDVIKSDLLEEEELGGHTDEFDDEGLARRIFSTVTGVDVTR
jgi:hypothetical protein